ncbi:MAG: Hpt domain-containing protein [Rhizomicrobium sp.]|jgi:chemotaxis protein histidine kinase CheA
MTGKKPASRAPHKRAHAIKIPPGAYPVFSPKVASRLSQALRDPQVVAAAARVIAHKAEDLRVAVLGYVDRMEEAARAADLTTTFEQAHEIRGLAGNAGLVATGRIANGLCKYLDAIDRAGRTPDQTLVALHLEAIARAARAEDEATRLGDTVANELAALVDKKLAEINDSARRKTGRDAPAGGA